MAFVIKEEEEEGDVLLLIRGFSNVPFSFSLLLLAFVEAVFSIVCVFTFCGGFKDKDDDVVEAITESALPHKFSKSFTFCKYSSIKQLR